MNGEEPRDLEGARKNNAPPTSTDGAGLSQQGDVPLDVLPVLEVFPADTAEIKRPRPGFWEAVLWTVVYGGVLQLVLALGTGIVAVAVRALKSDDPQKYFAQFGKPGFAESAEYHNLELVSQMLFLSVFPIVGALLGYMLIRLTSGRPWKRRLAVRKPALVHVILTILGLPAMAFLSDAVYRLALLAHVPTFNYQDQVTKMVSQFPVGFSILVICLGPAFAEELWCRGFLGRGLVARFGCVGGVLLSSFFFGVMHLDPPHILATFTMGICLHCAYLATKSLWIPMLLHFLNNLLDVLASTLWKNEPAGKAIDEPGMIVYAASLILGLAIGWALYRSRVRLVPAPATEAPAWQPAFPGVELPPKETSTQVVHSRPDGVALVFVAIAVLIFAAALFV